MSTPAGHALGESKRYTNGALTVFAAECECGTTVWHRLLWKMWFRHEDHLAEVKAQSMRNHPSAGGAA